MIERDKRKRKVLEEQFHTACQRLGWFPIVLLTVDDVQQLLSEELDLHVSGTVPDSNMAILVDAVPTDHEVDTACQQVVAYWDLGSSAGGAQVNHYADILNEVIQLLRESRTGGHFVRQAQAEVTHVLVTRKGGAIKENPTGPVGEPNHDSR